jgi:hypothetical protein
MLRSGSELAANFVTRCGPTRIAMSALDPGSELAAPKLSVILVTDHYRTIRPVIARLRDQRARAALEIVLVVPADQSTELDPSALEGFAGVRCIEVGAIIPLGPARAAGVHAASAPVVVIGETHSFPDQEWAEALIEEHTRPWAVVVPAFDNANPESALSWAAFLRDYGLWVNGLPAGETAFTPPYNTAVKREVLVEFGDQLESMISQGEEFALALQARSLRTYFQPAAKIGHANISRPWPWVRQRFLVGRIVGGKRAEQWSGLRRLLYVCASPLIPAAILSKLVGSVRLVRRTQRLPRGTLPALVIGALASAAGELVSYISGGSGDSRLRNDEYELFKLRYTSLPPP